MHYINVQRKPDYAGLSGIEESLPGQREALQDGGGWWTKYKWFPSALPAVLIEVVIQNGEGVAGFYETTFCVVPRKDLVLRSALSLGIEQSNELFDKSSVSAFEVCTGEY